MERVTSDQPAKVASSQGSLGKERHHVKRKTPLSPMVPPPGVKPMPTPLAISETKSRSREVVSADRLGAAKGWGGADLGRRVPAPSS
jgi:hypothetical protein